MSTFLPTYICHCYPAYRDDPRGTRDSAGSLSTAMLSLSVMRTDSEGRCAGLKKSYRIGRQTAPDAKCLEECPQSPRGLCSGIMDSVVISLLCQACQQHQTARGSCAIVVGLYRIIIPASCGSLDLDSAKNFENQEPWTVRVLASA